MRGEGLVPSGTIYSLLGLKLMSNLFHNPFGPLFTWVHIAMSYAILYQHHEVRS
jgi:hypothetical protein